MYLKNNDETLNKNVKKINGNNYYSLFYLAKACNRTYPLFYMYSQLNYNDERYIKTVKIGYRMYVTLTEARRVFALYNKDKKRIQYALNKNKKEKIEDEIDFI